MHRRKTVKGFIVMLLAMLLLPFAANAASWTDLWTGAGSGPPRVQIGHSVYIVLPVAAGDAGSVVSPLLTVTHLATVCMDTNFATLPGVSEGAGVVKVVIPAERDNADGLKAAEVGELTGTSPCIHAGPGPIVIVITTPPTTAGGIVVAGY